MPDWQQPSCHSSLLCRLQQQGVPVRSASEQLRQHMSYDVHELPGRLRSLPCWLLRRPLCGRHQRHLRPQVEASIAM